MAIAYSKVDQKNLNNAVKKAKTVKPHVKVLDFGKFEVTGSKGEPYQVEFSKQGGEFVFSCTCPGHKKNLVCYHTVSCSSIFKHQVKTRAAERAALAASSDMPDCNGCQHIDCPLCNPRPAAIAAPAPEVLDVADPDAFLCSCGADAFSLTSDGAKCINCLIAETEPVKFTWVFTGNGWDYTSATSGVDSQVQVQVEEQHEAVQTQVACYHKGCSETAETDGLCANHLLDLALIRAELFG